MDVCYIYCDQKNNIQHLAQYSTLGTLMRCMQTVLLMRCVEAVSRVRFSRITISATIGGT